MNKHIVGVAAAALLTSAVFAQSAQTGSHNPVVKDSTVHHIAAPAEGANSFSEAQARGRIAKAGYSSVSKLAKDDKGVWRGMAMRRGKKVAVGLDYKGNVVTR